MVKVLDRKLLRDLYAARMLLLAVVLILGLGVSAYVMNLSLYFNLELSRRSYYAECRMADFWVDVQRFPQAEVDRLTSDSGITELRARIVMPVAVDIEGVDKPLSGTIISMPADPRPVINNLVLRQGGYFTNLRREEVIISDGFARSRNIRPGDRIHVLLNDRRQELIVVGTAISAEFVFARAPGAMIPDQSGYVVMYVKERFRGRGHEPGGRRQSDRRPAGSGVPRPSGGRARATGASCSNRSAKPRRRRSRKTNRTCS